MWACWLISSTAISACEFWSRKPLLAFYSGCVTEYEWGTAYATLGVMLLTVSAICRPSFFIAGANNASVLASCLLVLGFVRIWRILDSPTPSANPFSRFICLLFAQCIYSNVIFWGDAELERWWQINSETLENTLDDAPAWGT